MVQSVLVVCVGNICRSPLGERLLRRALPDLDISSAGIAAVVGAPADADASTVAAEIGLDLGGHIARQLTADLGHRAELILVMEPGHKREIQARFAQLSGRVMLFDQWSGAKGIPDPYRKPQETHRSSRDLIVAGAAAWVPRLRR